MEPAIPNDAHRAPFLPLHEGTCGFPAMSAFLPPQAPYVGFRV